MPMWDSKFECIQLREDIMLNVTTELQVQLTTESFSS